MPKYQLTVNVKGGDVERREIEADDLLQAVFLLGAEFGMTAALRDRLYIISAGLLGEEKVVDTFVESAQENITSVNITAV